MAKNQYIVAAKKNGVDNPVYGKIKETRDVSIWYTRLSTKSGTGHQRMVISEWFYKTFATEQEAAEFWTELMKAKEVYAAAQEALRLEFADGLYEVFNKTT